MTDHDDPSDAHDPTRGDAAPEHPTQDTPADPAADQPTDALGGLDPQRLMQQGLGDSSYPADAPTIDEGPVLLTTPAGGSSGSASHTGPFVPPTAEALDGLLPQFHVTELLGRGGMGAVYKAHHATLDRFVAIKILPPQIGRDPAFAERFSREAKALAKLSHPNIVAVYDAGHIDLPDTGEQVVANTLPGDKLYYFVMEYVDGVSLRQVVREGKLPPADALAIVPQICEALQFAHDEGIVHRDIKPDNILMDTRGRVKIADFGLAKLMGKSDADVTLTGTNHVMGTPSYMAPEQHAWTAAVDHRADIYSLGVVFYEMLTGSLPMGRFDPPSKKVQVDVRLDEIVLHALENEPARRYQHASEVKTDVEKVRTSGVLQEVQPDRPAPVAKSSTSVKIDPSVQKQIHKPAVGLIVAGALHLISGLAVIVSGALFMAENELDPVFGYAIIGAGVLSMPLGVLVLVGAVKMLRMRSSGWAMAAAIIAMNPLSHGALLGIPFGIWALMVLSRDKVSEAFERIAAERGVEKSSSRSGEARLRTPAELLVAAAILAALTGIGLVAWWFGTGEFEAARTFREAPMQWNMMGIAATHGLYALMIGLSATLMLARRWRIASLLLVIVFGLLLPGMLIANVLGTTVPEWPALIPFWLSTPVALWATIALLRHDVREAYDHAELRPLPRGVSVALVSIIVIAVLGVGGYVGYQALRGDPLVINSMHTMTGFVESDAGPVMSDKMARDLSVNASERTRADAIFQNYHRLYLALERKHTTAKFDAEGRVAVTIEPFADEMFDLTTRMWNELKAIVDPVLAPPAPVKGHIGEALPLFDTAGEARVVATMWREADRPDGYTHFFDQKIEWVNGSRGEFASQERSADAFPEKFRTHWVDPLQRWWITVENRNESPCSVDVRHALGQAAINNIAKGEPQMIADGRSDTTMGAIHVEVGGVDHEINNGEQLPVGHRLSIVVTASGEVETSLSDAVAKSPIATAPLLLSRLILLAIIVAIVVGVIAMRRRRSASPDAT